MVKNSSNGAKLGFENKLWEMADKMRGHMDSGEYKHVVLGMTVGSCWARMFYRL